MRVDDQIRLQVTQVTGTGRLEEVLEANPERVGPATRATVEIIVEAPHQVGRVADQIEITTAIQSAKKSAGQIQDIDQFDIGTGCQVLKGLFEGMGRNQVPTTGGGVDNQDDIFIRHALIVFDR